MALTKYASFEVSKILEVKGAPSKQHTASLDKIGEYHDYRDGDGYLYVHIRAISSRVNKNNDGWPSVELAGGRDVWNEITDRRESADKPFKVGANSSYKYGYSTFVGKPIFVDHNNSDPGRTRGVIVDSHFLLDDAKTSSLDPYYSSDDVDPEHLPPASVDLLLEVDAKEFPVFASAIERGDLDGFSMGCDVEYSKCSHCGHIAHDPSEYCSHIVMKGAEHNFKEADGSERSKKSYENCYGIKFFEISGVFDPADATAKTKAVLAAIEKEAEQPPLPQAYKTKAPDDVDTLREERVCPQCGADMDGPKCEVCGFEEPPESLQNPDLQRGQEFDPQLGEPEEQAQAFEDTGVAEPQAGSYLQTRKNQPTSSVIGDMRWAPRINSRLEARFASKPKGDEPDETVRGDQPTPVTSAFRTAQELIAAAARRNPPGEQMNDTTKVAADPADPSGKAKKRVDTTGVGGVDEATAESASKADVRVDVEGKGGVIEDSNEAASSPDEKQSITETSDNAGFDKGGNPGNNSGPTKTFDNSNEPGSAVSDKAFPTSAKKGTEPSDPVGKPDERVDVDQEVTYANPNSVDDQWTGTDGNGVTRQVNPVTREVFTGKVGAHFVSALKQADDEEALGLITRDEKYNRLAELLDLSEPELAAEQRVTARVKTSKLTQPRTASRKMPSFRRIASTDPEPPAPVNDELLDNGLFI